MLAPAVVILLNILRLELFLSQMHPLKYITSTFCSPLNPEKTACITSTMVLGLFSANWFCHVHFLCAARPRFKGNQKKGRCDICRGRKSHTPLPLVSRFTSQFSYLLLHGGAFIPTTPSCYFLFFFFFFYKLT